MAPFNFLGGVVVSMLHFLLRPIFNTMRGCRNVLFPLLLPGEREIDIFIDNGDTLLPIIFNVDPTHIVEGEILSSREATTATVFKAKWQGRDVAVKKFCGSKSTLNHLLMSQEANYMRRVRHPNVLNFLGCYFRKQGDTVKSATLITELLDCNLKDYVPPGTGFPFKGEGLHIISQLARGLNHIHKMGLCHRDVKPENLLVKRTRHYAHVKVADFGCSHLMSSPSNPNSGTRWYKAPEQFPAEEIVPEDIIPAKLDVYSFAVVVSWILTGVQPSGGEPRMPWTDLPDDVQALIRRCLSRKPNERPEFQEICDVLDREHETEWELSEQPKKSSIVCDDVAAVEQELQARGFNHGMSAHHCIESDLIRVLSQIGQGTDAVVYKVKYRGEWYAGRALPKKTKVPDEPSKKNDQSRVMKFLNEWYAGRASPNKKEKPQESKRAELFQSWQAGRQKHAQHENIVQYYGFSLRKKDTLFVTELMQEDLGQILLMRSQGGKRPFDANESLSIMKKVAGAMKHLHVKMDCWHGDLHCSNIMVSAPSRCLKGCSKQECHPPLKGHSTCLEGMKVKLTDFCSDPFRCAYDYGALEMLELLRKEAQYSDAWSRKSDGEKRRLYRQWDVYSFAVLCYQILTGFFPLDEIVRQTCRDRRTTLREGVRPTLPEDTEENLKKLIEKCWDRDPDARPGFAEIHCRLSGLRPDAVDCLQAQAEQSCKLEAFPIL